MADFPIIEIRSEEDISLLLYHLNRGDKVGITFPIDVNQEEYWRLFNIVHKLSKESFDERNENSKAA